ncbi:hypothetical protein VM1G_11298 [Cytospora mali]|uniref:Uncharacterized protein n=1 Tax=Cytospora mali TaxID=578113 RepID=A0A194VL28_CYTMA|nr:hypothetical protein VM1G_11298 [Valsa mali]
MVRRTKTRVSRFNAQNTRPGDGDNTWLAKLPRDSQPKLAEATMREHERVWSDWNAHPEVDHEKLWEKVVDNDHDAKPIVAGFIDHYIKLAGRPTRASNTTERLKQRPVTCVSTANGIMKQQGSKAWLRFAQTQGPAGAHDIGPWIATATKDKWGLTIDSEYEKAGATTEDLQRNLQILWERADHIPMPP